MEVLPNELLVECFKYLDGLDIFQSFDGLNHRFSTLIRSVPLYIDFENMTTENYYSTALQLFSNVELKKQIYSLKITTNNGYQLKLFALGYAIDGLIHLRSLSSRESNINFEMIVQMNLQKALELTCFHMPFHIYDVGDSLSLLPMSQLRVLTLLSLLGFNGVWNIFSTITNLTLRGSSGSTIHNLLTYAINLKYLHVVMFINIERHENYEEIRTDPSKSLKHLTIDECCNDDFPLFESILKRTGNLISLTLAHTATIPHSFINQWEHLIRTSIPNLKIFNFSFQYSSLTKDSDIRQNYEQLQTDFWLKEHHWYTDCILSKNNKSMIYTVPYKWNRFELSSFSDIYSNQMINRRTLFANVNSLDLSFNSATNSDIFYFPFLTSISLDHDCLNENYFQWLRSTVNRTNVNSLYISAKCQFENSHLLLELLKQSPKISSLSIHRKTLLPLFHNDQLCEYLSKTIKKLTLLKYDGLTTFKNRKSFDSIDEKFARTFVNVEKLNCTINERQSIQFILESLPKLSNLEIHTQNDDNTTDFVEFTETIATKLGIQVIVEKANNINYRCSIWIIRNTMNKT